MLFDPDDGRSIEEILNRMLARRPDLRAHIDELALASGKSFNDIANECLGEGLKQMEDPARRDAMYARIAWRQTPFWNDPLLRSS
jgi:hypothetical protein